MAQVVPMTIPETKPKREQWGSSAEFFLAALGYSVGMGSLTRFPYMVMKNGGGAFLVAFCVAMVVMGIPLFYLETILGQFSGHSPLTMWVICPAFKGIGYSMTLLTMVATSYYMPYTWSLVYLVVSCDSDVPWRGCDNDWNTDNCGEYKALNDSDTFSSTPSIISTTELINASKRVSPAEEYWNREILEIHKSSGLSDIGDLKWYTVLAHFTSYLIVFLAVIKGTASAGKVVYVTATLPYVLLTVLVIKGVLLEGSVEGIKYFLRPRWEMLTNPNIWLEAAIQVLFQLGPAWGSLITMSRYNDFHRKVYREAVIIPIGNLLTAIYGGIALFSILGYMSHKYGIDIEDVAGSGPGLAFVVYPEAIAELPVSPVWAVVFFLMLISVAIDSQLAFFETVVSGIADMFPSINTWKSKMIVSGVLAVTLFTAGLPLCTQGGMYVYQILDWYGAVLTFTLIAFFESIVIAYIYGLRRFYSDAKLMFGSPPNLLVGVAWFVVTPVVTATLAFIGLWNLEAPEYQYTDYQYPSWGIGIGWLVASLSFLPIPITLMYVLLKHRGNLKTAFKPTEEWLPVKEELVEAYRKRWYRKSSHIYTVLAAQNAPCEDVCGDYFVSSTARREQLFADRMMPAPPPYDETKIQDDLDATLTAL